VSEPAVDAGPAGTSWRRANVVLLVLALVLLTLSVVFFTKGAAATPGDSRAEALSRDYKQVIKDATEQTTAFLTVDYKDMDPLIEKVLAGATGTFKEQYEQSKVNLKASAEQSKATSTGKVLSVGIADIDDTDAVVFLAADSQVSNSSTKGQPQPRYYRLKLTMLRKGDKWLTSNLEFVG
jgi:Mce-associated membrane protein